MKRTMLTAVKFFTMTAVLLSLLTGCDSKYVVLNPQGPVAETQMRLIVISAIICAIVVIPVIGLMAYIVYRYRDKPDNKAPYTPEWNDSKLLETVWWGIPVLIIGILGFFTVRDTFALAKPPVTDSKPVTIQVVSMDWKWLFQYPDQGIATVNYVEIPAGVPVHFELTSDAPMNSFWIPELGGQEYTMPGMAMRMWLQANKPGEYYGTGANFSGEGFAHMRFNVVAKPQAEFEQWVSETKKGNDSLTKQAYEGLLKPGLADKMTFSSVEPGLFDEIVMKNGHNHNMNGTPEDQQSHPAGGHDHMNMNMNMTGGSNHDGVH